MEELEGGTNSRTLFIFAAEAGYIITIHLSQSESDRLSCLHCLPIVLLHATDEREIGKLQKPRREGRKEGRKGPFARLVTELEGMQAGNNFKSESQALFYFQIWS